MSEIPHDEQLARFLHSEHLRADKSIKPNAFMPPKSLELSVTCHADGLGPDLWHRGWKVMKTMNKCPLRGRADLSAGRVRQARPLDAVPAPIDDDAHHAHVVNWPPLEQKHLHKALALELSTAATFVECPTSAPPG